jgi:dipeptidyl aminopeptidase/acylaminoacyl peptidase
MSEVRAFGGWPSVLTPEVMATGSRRMTAPVFASDGSVVWAESRPHEGGRTTLMRRDVTGAITELLPSPWDVGTRVHEYGGRAHAAVERGVVFVHRPDHSVWLRDDSGDVRPLVGPSTLRIAEPVFDATHARLVAVGERHVLGREPTACLVEIAIPSGDVTVLREGADFYASPTLDADGSRIAWIEWNHPHMPWDAAEVWLGKLDREGAIAEARHVAGDASASAQQPVFGPDGALYFLWEKDGAWTIWRDGPVCVLRSDAELGGPMWNLGMRTWGFVDRDHALAVKVERGLASVVRVDIARGEAETVISDLASIGHLAATNGYAAILEGWDGRGSALRIVDARGGTVLDRDGGKLEALPAAWWSQPEAIEFPTSAGDTAHAWFYRPHHPECVGPQDALPPVVVVAHGGPTGVALASAHLAAQFWTTRGFAVIDVNYRGSTGFGRAYRERLRGMWGAYDVADCVAAAKYVAARGLVDPKRMIIRGASAGGFTVLAALAFYDVFHAGASYYGVSDVASLVSDTHKFESHYDRYLFGEHEDPSALWRARSPLHHADRIGVPVIFFQGMDDPAVPPSQTERMVEALRARGIDVEYRAYEGEGHGFRKAENVIDSWTREAAFYRRVLRLDE